MPEAKDWITYALTAANIIVSIILSYMVWKVTKKATDIAQESFHLTQLAESRRREDETSLRRRIFRDVIRSAEDVHEVIDLVAHGKLKFWGRYSNHDNPQVSEADLAKYLTRDELDVVDRIWANFRMHKRNHWTNVDGSTKMDHTTGETEEVIKSAKLIEPILWESLEALRLLYKQS